MKRRVFITGVAGFLGSHLAQHHLDRGDIVHGVDSFVSSRPSSKHFFLLKKNPRFEFKSMDICATEDEYQKEIFPGMINVVECGLDNEGGYDIIYNFACPASPPIYQKFPVETMLTCTVGVHHILEGARLSMTEPVVIHASTSEVYGDPESSPQVESYTGRVHSWGPRACYDEGKRAAEALSFDYRNKHSVDVRLVRIFNTYGPHMDPDDGRVVTNFIKQALANKDITVYGSGEQTRSFCYVTDLIDGITRLAELTKEDAPDHPINLGNPGEFTISELANAVLELIPESKSKIDHKPLPVHDPLQRKPDITQAKKYLGDWEPQVTLTQGLSELIPYMRLQLKKQ